MAQIEVNGTQLHVTDTGGPGAAIVFSHGLLLDGTMFGAQVAALRGRYRCVTYDHRGQGKSAVTATGYDMDTLTLDAAALIRHLDLAPCHFVGLSMGGFVGMRLAARRPDLLRSLTLLNTSADPEDPQKAPGYRMLNFVARWVGLWAVIGRVMPLMFGQSYLTDVRRDADRRRWSGVITGNDRIGITRAVTGMIGRAGCAGELAGIDMPVGIGVGAQDVAMPPARSERLHRAIRASELVIFEGVGHSCSIEAPDQVTALIERTLRRATP
ncbi:MAG: alpha/beta hydrolase [Pseudomonadota bacterium]